MSKLRITPAEDAFPKDRDKRVGTAFHFHHDATNAHPDHKHELAAPGESFDCPECGEYVRKAQKAHADNYVGWKVERV